MSRKKHEVIPLGPDGREVALDGTHVVYLDVDNDDVAEAQLIAKLADLTDLADRRHGLTVTRLRVVDPDTGKSFDWTP